MAEGWARHLKGDVLEPYSAGIEKHGLNQRAVKVMAEAGVDISNQTSTLIRELPEQDFDYVVTLCSHAHESCPLLPGKSEIIHKGFDDPPKFVEGVATDEEALECYRRVRDEIREYVLRLPEALKAI